MVSFSLKRRAAIVGAVSLLGVTPAAQAGRVYGLSFNTETEEVTLVHFDSAAPRAVTTVGAITGLAPGQSPGALDFRPSNGKLYLGAGGLPLAGGYTLDLLTAVATPAGPGFDPRDPEFGPPSFDFDPVRDQLRVVTTAISDMTRTNAHSDPDRGGPPEVDTDLAFVPGDPGNDSEFPLNVVGIAYANNVDGASSTTLYGYDLGTDTIVTIGDPGGSADNGQLRTVGASGIVVPGSIDVGFDIADTGAAFLSAPAEGIDGVHLFGVDLATGRLNDIGAIGSADGSFVFDIAVAPSGGATPIPLPGAVAMFPLAAAIAGFSTWRARRRMLRT